MASHCTVGAGFGIWSHAPLPVECSTTGLSVPPGNVLVTAVSSQDLPVVVGIVTLVAVVYVLANLLVDIVYTVVDPRLAAS